MPPAVALIAQIIVVEAGLSTIATFVWTLLINATSMNYAKNHLPDDPSNERRHVKRISDAPMIVLYGERRISGPLVYWATGDDIGYDKSLVMVIAFAEHEFESIESVYLGEIEAYSGGGITSGALTAFTHDDIPDNDRFAVYLGESSQVANQRIIDINTNPAWTSDHRGDGVAYIMVYLDSYEDWDNIPDVSVIAKGAKVYDPRLDHDISNPSTWEYSTNPALITRDYLTRDEGYEESHTKVDDTWAITSADACVEEAEVPPGGVYQDMYTCNLAVSMGNTRKVNLLQILGTMRGDVPYVGGRWLIMAGQYITPTITITEDDIIGDFIISQSTSASSTYNYVTGTYYDKNRFYQSVNFLPRSNAAFETRDNGRRIPRDIRLVGVTEEYQAQRLAVLELNASEHQTMVTFRGKPNLMDLHKGMLINLTTHNPTWTNKVFRIEAWELNEDLSIKLTLRDEFPETWNVPVTIYNDESTAPGYDPYNQLSVPPPTNVVFDTGNSTSIVLSGGGVQATAKLTWDSSTDGMLHGYRIRYRPVSNAAVFSEAALESLPSFYFKGDETSGTVAVNSGIYPPTGVYGTDASTTTVAGLGDETGTAIAVNEIAARITTISNLDTLPVNRDFAIAIAFEVTSASIDTHIIGQWGATTAEQKFKIGTMPASTNIAFSIREDDSPTYTLRNLDAGSPYDSGQHLAIVNLRNNTLTLAVDGTVVDTFDATNSTFDLDMTNDITIGHAASGNTFYGTWDDALFWNKNLSSYDAANLYSLWLDGTLSSGLDSDWRYTNVGPSETEWIKALDDQRYYDFSIEARNSRGIYSTPSLADSTLLLSRQVLASDFGPDQLDGISYRPVTSGVEAIADCSSSTNNDVANIEWALSADDNRANATFLLGTVPNPALGTVNGVDEITTALVYTGNRYLWARLINTSGEAGSWNDLSTNGLLATSGPASSSVNFIPPRLRGSFYLTTSGYVFHQTTSSDYLIISALKLTANEDYMSCSTWVFLPAASTTTTATLHLDYLNSGTTVIQAYSQQVTPNGSDHTQVKIEAAKIPTGAYRVKMYITFDGNDLAVDKSVLNKGITTLDSISGFGDRLLDPYDNDVDLGDLGDNQNLLDGDVEEAETTTGVPAGGGGPVLPPTDDGGGYYEDIP